MASQLISLNKSNGDVKPIGVGEVDRRITGKCVTKVTKQDITEASGSLQVCAGQKSGSEAAIHAILPYLKPTIQTVSYLLMLPMRSTP